MAITSSSTPAEVLAQYNNNLSWDGDIVKAKLALEAIRWLLVNRAAKLSINGRNLDYTSLEKQEESLSSFVKQSNASSNVTSNRVTFTRGRALL